jgi:hypothetical protein
VEHVNKSIPMTKLKVLKQEVGEEETAWQRHWQALLEVVSTPQNRWKQNVKAFEYVKQMILYHPAAVKPPETSF